MMFVLTIVGVIHLIIFGLLALFVFIAGDDDYWVITLLILEQILFLVLVAGFIAHEISQGNLW